MASYQSIAMGYGASDSLVNLPTPFGDVRVSSTQREVGREPTLRAVLMPYVPAL